MGWIFIGKRKPGPVNDTFLYTFWHNLFFEWQCHILPPVLNRGLGKLKFNFVTINEVSCDFSSKFSRVFNSSLLKLKLNMHLFVWLFNRCFVVWNDVFLHRT